MKISTQKHFKLWQDFISNSRYIRVIEYTQIEVLSHLFQNLYQLHQGGIFDAPRLIISKEKPVDLTEFVGEFYSDELSTKYILTLENDTIIVKHSRLTDSRMTPVNNDNYFRADKWYLGQIKFVRDEDKSISGFKVSNGRVLNLWFEKITD